VTTLRSIEFEYDAKLAREYLALVERVHADDPAWIAPLRKQMLDELAPSHAFFRREGNIHRGFAVRRGETLVGHLLATVNTDQSTPESRTGALGFLEVEEDYEAFRCLAAPAIDWLRGSGGVQRVWATMNFDIWHGYRLMTRGFDLPAFFGEPRNAAWLPEFLERLGFTVSKRWVSVTTGAEFLLDRAPYFRPRYEAAIAEGYTFEPLCLKKEAEIAALHRSVSASIESFEEFTPISLEEFKKIVVNYLRFVGAQHSTMLRTPDGTIAGFSIAFPDPSDSIRKLEGRDDWLHRLKLLRKSPSRTALHYMIGLLPGADLLRGGLGSALFYKTLQMLVEGGFESTTFALMSEDSPARYFAMDQVEIAQREYALFELRV